MSNYLNLKRLLLFLFIGITGFGYSQSISPQSINSAGVKMSQTNGSLSFILGEAVVLSASDLDSNTINSGFISGATITTEVLEVPNVDLLNVKVYPNPTPSMITVDVMDTQLSQMIIEIVDMNGKVISKGTYAGISNKIGINASSWENGNYILQLKDISGNRIGSYQIIKQD